MIASRLILWHTYSRGVAFDLSENRNHGTIVDATYGDPGFPSALHFKGGPGAVWVKPSSTLSNIGAVRTQVNFNWDPTGNHRHNLVEGELAFAFFVNPDGSLQGTILNALGQWAGATSAPGVISAGQWHTGEFLHDGVCTAKLYVDGTLVAEEYSSPGPVGTVASRGLAIGHWPEPADVYSFEGYIDRVKVWCDDPKKDTSRLIDGCCIDRPAIADQLTQLTGAGLDAGALDTVARTMLDVGRETATFLAQGSAANRDEALALGGRLLSAYQSGDVPGLAAVVEEGAARLQANASPEQIMTLWSRLEPALAQVPIWGAMLDGDLAEIEKWLAPWCLDGWVRPKPGEPHRPKPAHDDSTDPDTDAPPGETPPGWTDSTTHEQPPPPPDTPPTPETPA